MFKRYLVGSSLVMLCIFSANRVVSASNNTIEIGSTSIKSIENIDTDGDGFLNVEAEVEGERVVVSVPEDDLDTVKSGILSSTYTVYSSSQNYNGTLSNFLDRDKIRDVLYGDSEDVTPTPTPTPESTPVPEITVTPTPTPESTPVPTPTPDVVVTPTPTPTQKPNSGGNNSSNNNSNSSIVVTPMKPSFSLVKKVPALVNVNTNLNVREGKEANSRVIGKLPKNSVCYILADPNEDRVYIESGEVRGFVSSDYLITGKEAENYCKANEGKLIYGKELVSWNNNKAYTYTDTTSNSNYVNLKSEFYLVDRVYAMANVNSNLHVREGKSANSEIVGKIPKNGVCFILADKGSDWVYIESGEVRGFASSKYLIIGKQAEDYYNSNYGNIKRATPLVSKDKNAAYYYTNTSTNEYSKGYSQTSSIRQNIVNYALQFVGNPYVWGGESLTQGADCSGFVQTIYKTFGYSLPRVSYDQAEVGKKIPVSEAKPGDLVFYSKNGTVYHVAICMGNGKIVHAKSTKAGIVSGDAINYSGNACWAVDIIGDSVLKGCVDGTDYSQEQLELIWALVGQEDSTSYEGALGVITSAMNRAEINYCGYGTSALEQLTAPGQYCYSPNIGGNWQARLNGNVRDYVKQAVADCLKGGIRNHSFLHFRSTNATGNRTKIGENWYF